MPNYLVIEEKHTGKIILKKIVIVWFELTQKLKHYVVLVSLKVYMQVNSPCVD